ncbi:MAG: hypothetical protein GXO23_03845 [Crenarchaeota archaeon]|nr:hypothetical protein [Thermoproteota archaeon]
MCSVFSQAIIRRIVGSGVIVRNIPINCEYFPYVSSSDVEIVRKIGLIHIINDIFIRRLIDSGALDDRERVCILHYVLMVLGYNYDSSKVSLGRVMYERYRAVRKVS